MPAIVVGELSADQASVVLMAVGPDWEVAEASRRLTLLTPLCKQTDPPGALRMPTSWPAVVQLSAAFAPYWRPGPRLAAWISEQVQRRTGDVSAMTLAVAPPAGKVPRSYQVGAACMIREAGSMLIFDEPGTGKSMETVLGLVERAHAGHRVHPTIVVAPSSVVDPWIDEFRAWAPGWKVRAWRGSPAQRRAMAGSADVYVTSYGTARRDAADTNPRTSPLIGLRAATVVADECFPAGTLVLTPDGQRAIETLTPGSYVLGIDHATGALTPTRVRHTFTSTTDAPLIGVGGVVMTPSHPVWTARGYVPATEVTPDDLICEVQFDGAGFDRVRVVRNRDGEAISPEESNSLLQQELLGELAHGATRNPSSDGHATPEGTGSGEVGRDNRTARGSGQDRRAPEWAVEPVPRPGGAADRARGSQGEGIPGVDRRQRTRTHEASSAVGVAPRLAAGGRGANLPDSPLPAGLQDRRGLARFADWDRGGRHEPQRAEGSGTGRAQGSTANRAGLDGAALHQPASATGNGPGTSGDRSSRVVHNIETGTGNYIAGGLLVHNCHLLKHQASSQSRAVRRLAAGATTFIGLSGTPVSHSPADLWPALVALEPGAWPSRERWVGRYCTSLPGDYSSTVTGLNPHTEPEFRTAILGRHRRVAKADVLAELPPKIYSVRSVELPPAYRVAYDGMEGDMLAQLPDGGELSVMSVLAKLTRLAQLASAAADVETSVEIVPDPFTGLPVEREHVKVRLKLPSWKVDALLEVLEERPGQPVVAFAPSRQLMMLAAEAATYAGMRVGHIVGGQTPKERTANREAFQASDLDLLCVTTGAGGVGLTLTAARTAVFLQRPWSLIEAMQAEDRLHRIGAEGHESIEIIDIVARKTIDTRVRAVLRERAGQLADLVQDRRVVTELLGGAEVRDLRKGKAAA